MSTTQVFSFFLNKMSILTLVGPGTWEGAFARGQWGLELQATPVLRSSDPHGACTTHSPQLESQKRLTRGAKKMQPTSSRKIKYFWVWAAGGTGTASTKGRPSADLKSAVAQSQLPLQPGSLNGPALSRAFEILDNHHQHFLSTYPAWGTTLSSMQKYIIIVNLPGDSLTWTLLPSFYRHRNQGWEKLSNLSQV